MIDLLKEMVAGCCVCSDERGWAENPLVYCDGAGCNIAVHQACYGIKSVPDGNWYCRKCESQERSARVRCELCPSKDGALKRTDNGSWAHVVCGLYIPEVWFGDVAIMEPIVLSQIPTERYNKVCYICEQNNRGSRASVGACMQCNKAGCKQQFHVTCAQAMGLLCEEAGNYSDNVKYCGYCQEHFMKLKKGSNVKTIPPYRPLSFNNSGSEDSPEKKPPNYSQTPADLKQAPKRKSVSNRPLNQNGPTRSSTGDKKESLTNQPNVDHLNGTVNTNIATSNSQLTKNDNSSRFTTSNFVESVITPSESIFADIQKKRRKLNDQSSPVTVNNPEPERNSSKLSANQNEDDDDDGEDTVLNIVEEPNLSTLKQEPLKTSISFSSSAGSTIVTTVISSPSASASANNASVVLPVANVNVSQSNTLTNPVSTSYLSASTFSDVKTPKSDNQQPDKNRNKSKRVSGTNGGATKKNNKGSSEKDSSINGATDSLAASYAANNSPAGSFVDRKNSVQSNVSVKIEKQDPAVSNTTAANSLATSSTATAIITSAPTVSLNNQMESKESSVSSSPENSNDSKSIKTEDKIEKELKSFQSGSSAPHMLGNQLNPTSSMAQKMSETLNDELEAHSIFTNADSNASTSSFVGPPLYNKIISTTRASKSKRSNSPSNGPLASLSGSAANFPQSLEELLETQWEQGGTFLMEQAQHFDIASLLTCLHKLREENLGLEEHIRKLKARRDHLLGVNARLAMPLAPISQLNNVHPPSQPQSQPPVSQTQSQTTHHPPMLHISQQQSQSQQQSPSVVSHVSHPQQYQSPNQSQIQAGISESGNLRNIPLPGGIFSSASTTTLRGPHGSIYTHSLENGLPPTPSHHQHSRGMSSQSNPGAINRHHNASTNSSLYSGQSAANPGVVVRTPNLVDVQRTDRRNASVVSSNYQQSYQMSSISHQQMAMHRDDYHSVHPKQN